jgi:hypothetical protein
VFSLGFFFELRRCDRQWKNDYVTHCQQCVDRFCVMTPLAANNAVRDVFLSHVSGFYATWTKPQQRVFLQWFGWWFWKRRVLLKSACGENQPAPEDGAEE